MRLIFFAVLLNITLFFVACDQNKDQVIVLNQSELNQTFPSDLSSGSVSFTANGDWTARTTAKWIDIDRQSGSSGSVKLNVSLANNTMWSDRSGAIYISGAKGEIVVNIVQKAMVTKPPSSLQLLSKVYMLDEIGDTLVVTRINYNTHKDFPNYWYHYAKTEANDRYAVHSTLTTISTGGAMFDTKWESVMGGQQQEGTIETNFIIYANLFKVIDKKYSDGLKEQSIFSSSIYLNKVTKICESGRVNSHHAQDARHLSAFTDVDWFGNLSDRGYNMEANYVWKDKCLVEIDKIEFKNGIQRTRIIRADYTKGYCNNNVSVSNFDVVALLLPCEGDALSLLGYLGQRSYYLPTTISTSSSIVENDVNGSKTINLSYKYNDYGCVNRICMLYDDGRRQDIFVEYTTIGI